MMLAIPIATVSILFQQFSLISNEFRHGTSYIGNFIYLAFYAHVECPKQSLDVHDLSPL
jgi:hypothetical protein